MESRTTGPGIENQRPYRKREKSFTYSSHLLHERVITYKTCCFDINISDAWKPNSPQKDRHHMAAWLLDVLHLPTFTTGISHLFRLVCMPLFDGI
jgi:hypothetical protein